MTQLRSTPEPQFLDLLRSRLKYLKPGATLDIGQPLKSLGLDSMAAIDLLLDIEDTYCVILPDRFLTEETFSTALALWTVVDQLRSPVSSEG